MTNTPGVEAATSLADCPDCASVVHTIHRPGGILAVEVQHSTPCPAWPHDRREIAIILYGSGGDPADDGWTAEVGVGEAPGVPPEKGHLAS